MKNAYSIFYHRSVDSKIFPVDSLCIQYSYDCSEEGNQEEGISR